MDKRLHELSSFCASLAVDGEVSSMYENAARALCTLGDFRSCGIWRITPQKMRLILLAWRSLRRRTAPPFILTSSMCKELAQSTPLFLSAEEARDAGLGAVSDPVLIAPLIQKSNLWGVVVLIGSAAIDPASREWAIIATTQVGIALETVETRVSQKRMESLLSQTRVELPRLLATADNPQVFLSSFAAWIAHQLNANEYRAWSVDKGKLSNIGESNRISQEKLTINRRSIQALAEKAARIQSPIDWLEDGDDPTGSGLVIPLKNRSGIIGVISLLWRKMLAYDTPERDALLALVAQAEAALEEMRLIQESTQNLTQLADLSSSASSIASLPDTPTLIRVIIHATASALHAPIVVIATLNEKKQFVLSPHGHIGVTSGFVREFAAFSARESIGQRIMSMPGPVVLDPSDPLIPLLKGRAAACAPLTTSQDALGILIVGYTEPHTFSATELNLLSAYASQSALALNNLSLRDSLTKHLDRLGTFSEFGRMLASSLDLEQTLASILDSTHDVLEADAACIFLKDKEQGTLTLRASHGNFRGENSWAEEESRMGFGLPELAVEQDQIIVSRDLARDGRNKYRNLARIKGPVSAMVSPLKSKGRPLGAICVCTNKLRDFTEHDRRLLSMLADSAGIALENANLYEQEKDRAVFLASLVREANHRIRNSLQTIAGLLEVELTAPERSPAEALRKSITRIYCIAAVHGALSQREIQQVEMKESIQRIGEIVRRSAGRSADDIALQITGARLVLPSQKATSLSLAINELMDNSMQHGLATIPKGKVTVSIAQSDRTAVVTISDNGVGLPENFDIMRDAKVGLKIASGVATQDLNGKLTLDSNGQGTRAQIRFPLFSDPQTSILSPEP